MGSEFQVNSYTSGIQTLPDIASDDDGDFVVAWRSSGQDGSHFGVFARRFSSAGAPFAVELQVNTFTTSTQDFPKVAADADGDFVVAWESTDQDGYSYGVFARRFSSDGIASATDFQVDSRTTGVERQPEVAITADGGFVIAWQTTQDDSNFGIFARRFANDGTPLATELQVNTYTTNNQSVPAVAVDADGDFIVVWQSYTQDGSLLGVFARRFSSDGAPLTTEIPVNTYTASDQRDPAVAGEADGDFVVVWASDDQDGDLFGVFVRRFSSAGAALATELQVNAYTNGIQREPVVVADPNGDFVIVWQSFPQEGAGPSGGGAGVVARRFSSAGALLAVEFQVNTYTPSDQWLPAAAADTSGDFIVAWSSLDQDGSDNGVFAQRFASPDVLDIDGNGEVEALTDGLLLLRYLFGFTGDALTAGAFDEVGCTRCNAAAIESYLLTLP